MVLTNLWSVSSVLAAIVLTMLGACIAVVGFLAYLDWREFLAAFGAVDASGRIPKPWTKGGSASADGVLS